MEKTLSHVVFACVLLLTLVQPCHPLDHGARAAVENATFAFVAPSTHPNAPALIGTAFAIGPNKFVTAAHLLDEIAGADFRHPVLLDSRQVEHPIASILQFSERDDYAVVSLELPPRITPLPTQQSRSVPSDLYFAGWTRDRRIVIEPAQFFAQPRDEDLAQLDWFRFSAPVWAAAGGGPLLDTSGRVVGIVEAVARDGGPNYAAPIGVVSASGSEIAHIHSTQILRSLMPAVSSLEPLEGEIELPLRLDAFLRALQQLRQSYFDQMIRPLVEATRGNFIMSGFDAADACKSLNGGDCQCRPREGASGALVLDSPRHDEHAQPVDWAEDGLRKIAGAYLIRVSAKGDGSRRDDVANSATLHLQVALEGVNDADAQLPPRVEPGPIAANEDMTYTDFHGRTWRWRSWSLLARNSELTSVVREVPGGYIVLARVLPTSLSYAAALQLKFVANLIYYQCDILTGEGIARVADTMGR